jgi:hypothetical protein
MTNSVCNNCWSDNRPTCWCGNRLADHWRSKECPRTTTENKYGICVGQIWKRADGTNDPVMVVGFSNLVSDDVIIKRLLSGELYSIDMFKLSYRYLVE